MRIWRWRWGLLERPVFLIYDQVYWSLTFGDAAHTTPVSLVPDLLPYMSGVEYLYYAEELPSGVTDEAGLTLIGYIGFLDNWQRPFIKAKTVMDLVTRPTTFLWLICCAGTLFVIWGWAQPVDLLPFLFHLPSRKVQIHRSNQQHSIYQFLL